ncbi:hypothetical protein Gpo141_00010516 [Globisporangium polare]
MTTTTPPSRRNSPAAYERESEYVTPTSTTTSRPPWRFSCAFTIGRSRRSDVVIPTTAKTRTVSKLHVRVFPVRDSRTLSSPTPTDPHVTLLYAKPTRWVLQDLEAMNGTSLNGVDVPPGGSMELHDGDELVLASTMRHGARMMIQISRESGATMSVQLDEQDSIESPVPAPETSHTAAPVGAPRSPGFRTPPPPTRTLSRHTSSTVATKRERHHRDSTEKRHGHADGNEPMEDVSDAAAAPRKRSRRLEELDDQDRCMMCPICFEYFHSSVTLPCSHTFCGLCVSSWFRSSLSCPQCRTDVASLPVHNRALDDLVHRLVGETEAYKVLVAKRLKVQLECQREPPESSSRLPAAFRMPNFRNPFLSDSPHTRTSTSRTVSVVVAAATADEKIQPPPNVFTRWKQEEVARVRSILSKQFGETRLQTCRRMGLTESSMKQASTSQTTIAMQNLLLDWWPYERVRDEGDQRLQIFLHFG